MHEDRQQNPGRKQRGEEACEGRTGPGHQPLARGRGGAGGRRPQTPSGLFVRRHEQKYEIGVGAAAFLREEISKHLPLYEYVEGFPHTFVTTVYLDTRDYKFYERAERSYDNNIKLRVKEYYYRHHSGKYLTFPYCFLELKQRRSGTVYKSRLRITKCDIERVLAGDAEVWGRIEERFSEGHAKCGADEGVSDASRGAAGSGAPPPSGVHLSAWNLQTCQRIQEYLCRYAVVAASVVNYRRSVYQRDEEELRVTFDDYMAVYRAPKTLYKAQPALTYEVLGKPTYRSTKVILEIKCPSERYPGWLREALEHHTAKKLSKFTTSVRWVRGGDSSQDDIGQDGTRGTDPKAANESKAGGTQSRGGGRQLEDTTLFTEPAQP